MNYSDLGFKCGIEIHQQLDTESKLFCECPIDTENESADAKVERYLKSVEGESGERDEAAEMESARSRRFVYNYYDRCNCLVEIDEEPPHSINGEALDAALTFARMVDANIPSEIQVMRKMVVDGSNTSGFQRTAMIGLDGQLETESGTVKIDDIELEEESAGIHAREDDKAVYDLDRLGIPLVEVGTDASIKNPDHAREVAKKIGMLLRSTNKARRGLGTIRQDVNVSIEGGARVEIKGFQDVENIDRLIELEVLRQKNLIELGREVETREVLGDNVTHVFENSDNEIISTVLENDGSVYAVKIPGLAGKMKEPISDERYVAKELVDYAKSRGLKGIIHTDEDISGYGLEDEFNELAGILEKDEKDVLAVLAGPEKQAREAAKAVRDRAQKLLEGEVPEETRNAEQDFTTSYSRPLPGAARMYPETDIPPIRITSGKVEQIEQELPDTLEERENRYAGEIGEELASQIINSKNLGLFESLKKKHDSKLVANILTNFYSEMQSEGVPVENLKRTHYKNVIKELEEGEIQKSDAKDILEGFAKGEIDLRDGERVIELTLTETLNFDERVKNEIQQVKKELNEMRSSEEEIRETVKEVLEENSGMVEEQGMHAQGALMGMVMQRVDADGGTVSRILQEELEEKV